MTDRKGLGMYYEEQWIEGALCWRTSPNGAWTRYTANELAHRYESAEKRAADAQATVEALQAVIRQMGEQAAVLAKDGMAAKAQVDALQRVRDEFERERDQLHAALMEAKAALDAEREKVKGLESEGVKLFEWRLALHSLTPGGSEFCTPDACEQWVRKSRTSQHEYIIEQIKQRKGLQTQLSQLQDWRDQVTLALQRAGGARFEDVPGHVKTVVDDLTQLQALVRALPVVGGHISVIKEMFTTFVVDCRLVSVECPTPDMAQAIADLLQYRATLDATTPAADTSIIGKCEPPSQWNRNAQVRGDIS